MLFIFLVISQFIVEDVNGNDLPKSVIAEENPFRINKINYIWSKAVRHLPDKVALKRLKSELNKFDGLYLSAKEQSSKQSGYFIDEVDRKLETLLEKYDLSGAVNAFNKKMKWRNEEEMKMENSVLGSEKFSNPKLDKLWRAAIDAKFTERQLKALHKELKDHERKMEQYDEKVLKFNSLPHENALEDEVNHENIDKLNQELKDSYNEIEEEYSKLNDKILEQTKGPFRNYKVLQLWKKALKNSNFSSFELESLKVELEHFDKQLDKLEFKREELKINREIKRKSGKTNALNDDGIDEFEEEHGRIERKLKKLEYSLQSKIEHTEL